MLISALIFIETVVFLQFTLNFIRLNFITNFLVGRLSKITKK